MTVKTDFYVYVYFRPDGSPCYVGKGRRDRWRSHLRRTRNRHLANIVEAAGGDLPIVKIREDLNNALALEVEIALIRAIGRKADGGPLVNQTDGGEGHIGRKQSEEERALRRTIMGSPEVRAKMSASHKGKPSPKRGIKLPAHLAEKLRTYNLGKVQSNEEKERRASKLRGLKRSPGFCERLSKAMLGTTRSAETRAKMSAAKRGKPLSKEHRRAISDALFIMSERMSEIGRVGAAKRWGK